MCKSFFFYMNFKKDMHKNNPKFFKIILEKICFYKSNYSSIFIYLFYKSDHKSNSKNSQTIPGRRWVDKPIDRL